MAFLVNVHRAQRHTQVDFVAVNYFSHPAVEQLIDSLRRQVDSRWHLTVVDNSCEAGEIDAIARQARIDQRVSYVRAPKNLGYLGGVRLGIAELEPSTWRVLCNVDVLFDSEFVGTLLNKKYPGAPAPSIVWRARDQNPFLRARPTPRQLLRWELQFRWVPVARAAVFAGALLALLPSRRALPAGTPIYACHGACFILPGTYFDRGGELNHPAFLYGEEVYVAEQCRRLGIEVTYQPELGVRHQAHDSTGLFRSSELIRIQGDSIRHIRSILEEGDS